MECAHHIQNPRTGKISCPVYLYKWDSLIRCRHHWVVLYQCHVQGLLPHQVAKIDRSAGGSRMRPRAVISSILIRQGSCHPLMSFGGGNCCSPRMPSGATSTMSLRQSPLKSSGSCLTATLHWRSLQLIGLSFHATK